MLNSEQMNAVNSDSKHIFLLAGAGSGKTRVIVERVRRIISNNIDPNKILCITFTRKSAHEMKERISNESVNVHTFHQLAFIKIKNHMHFNMFDSEEQDFFDEKELLEVANYKNSLFTIKKPRVYKKYSEYLKNNELLDFDDLLIEYLKICSKHQYQYIFVDEFQDTNTLQYEILKKMTDERTNTFCVGDPDQSIYKFRGSDYRIIFKYLKEFKATLLKLEQNYRSKKAILDCSNYLIMNNKGRLKKHLITQNNDICEPKIYIYKTEYEKFIFIKHLIQKDRKIMTAIIYRCNVQANRLQNYLENEYCFNAVFLTFHESKGLEFNQVIILDPQIMPFDKDNTYSNVEEERRLLFVGMTRAKNNLYLIANKSTKFLDQTRLKYERIKIN